MHATYLEIVWYLMLYTLIANHHFGFLGNEAVSSNGVPKLNRD